MARPQPIQQLALLEVVLRRYPEGASISDLACQLAPPPDSRTLGRWLNMLIDQHRAVQLGTGDLPLYAATATPAMTAETDAVPVETTGASDEARFAGLFDDAVVPIVVGGMAPAQATAILQLQAAKERIPLAQRLAYVGYAKHRLESLQQAEAERIGILPESFTSWRGRWTSQPTPVVVAPAPLPPVALAEPAETPARHPPAIPVAMDEPDDPVVQLTAIETPLQQPRAPGAKGVRSDSDEVADVLSGLGLAQLVPLLRSTIALGKELFTWKRTAIAIVWGLLVTYLIQRMPGVSASMYLLRVPLIGLPWYVFLRASRRGQKPASREIVVAIGGGGGVTVFFVNLFYPIVLEVMKRI